MSDLSLMDLPVKHCHGCNGNCPKSFTLPEWQALRSLGHKGEEEVRACSLCGELMFMDVRSMVDMCLTVSRDQFKEIHPNSERVKAPEVYTIQGGTESGGE